LTVPGALTVHRNPNWSDEKPSHPVSSQAKKNVTKKATKKKAYLTKSRYVDGLWCTRKLWRGVHQPAPEAAVRPFSPIDLGNRVGRGARILFPGGVEVPGAQVADGLLTVERRRA